MVDFKTFFKAILNAVKVEASEEFDRNFERKAFFDHKWPQTKGPNAKGSLMMRTGALRRGNQSRIQGDAIVFTNSQAHAAIHNQGGTITVTSQMKKFFWAMYYQTSGKVKMKRGGGATKATRRYSAEAEYWKSLALMKVGSKMKIPQRQFIGAHPKIDAVVKKHFDTQMKEVEQSVKQMLSPKSKF